MLLTIVIIFIILAYLCGSLSSATLVCKLMKLPDPRLEGSGNPGATNVLRIGGKIPALLTLAGDILKGAVPILLARIFKIEGFYLGLIALAAFLGHLYPLFFKFKGGKGVATFLGVMLALSPIMGLALIVTWLIVAILFRYSSLAALVTAISAPIYNLLFANFNYIAPVIVMVLLIIWKHRQNIKKLQIGEESKIDFHLSH